MRIFWLLPLLFACSCSHPTPRPATPPPPPPITRTAIYKGCTESDKGLTCTCDPVHTMIDVKTGKTTYLCKFPRTGWK